MKNKSSSFEDSMKELAQIVEQMEQGDLPLEKSLECFERGIQLTQQCQKALQAAEQKIQILVQQQNELMLTPFEDEQNAD